MVDPTENKCCASCAQPCTQQCSVCQKVFYYSVECQRKDWKEHKKLHDVLDAYKIEYSKGGSASEWDNKGILKALREQAYLIVKLVDEDDKQRIRAFRAASQQLFEAPLVRKLAALRVPNSYRPPQENVSVGYFPQSGCEHLDVRTEGTFTHLYPDPSPLVPHFKDAYFPVYHLMGDITERLLQSIISQLPGIYLAGFDRALGADKSAVRILNYRDAGAWFESHLDTGSISISLCGTSVGLAVKQPRSGTFCFPELAMNPEEDLVVILGQDLEQRTFGRVKATVHAVTVKEPRAGAVFIVGTNPWYLTLLDSDEAMDDYEKYFVHKNEEFLNPRLV